jgi:hypothetical protein
VDCSDLLVGVVAAFVWTLIVLSFWAVRHWTRYFRLRGAYQGRMKGSDVLERTLRSVFAASG